MANIKVIGKDTYELNARGQRMVLAPSERGWRMTTQSAMTRAHSLGGASVKEFDNLMQVEAHYKSWRGLSALIAQPPTLMH